jgi:hypothetical protein
LLCDPKYFAIQHRRPEMTGDQVQEQLSIIREMVEKGRRETAESGAFLIWLGVIGILTVFAIRGLELSGLSHLTIPFLAVVLVVNGVVGYLTVSRRQKRAGARSYVATICYKVWFACGVSIVLVAFLLPALGAYPWSLVPVLAALFMGIGVFSTGAIFEVPAITWSSLAWWGGAVAMAIIDGPARAIVMAAAILLGMILPGAILNRRYRGQRGDDES